MSRKLCIKGVKVRVVPGVLIVSMLGLASCTTPTLINPYLEVENRPVPTSDLSTAIGYADGFKDKYREALGDRAEFRNVLGIGLISLSAATLGLAVSGGGSQDLITGLGLGAAGGYGIGTYLHSSATERAYIAGYNATNCAIESVLPFQFATRPVAKSVNETDTSATASSDSQSDAESVGESDTGATTSSDSHYGRFQTALGEIDEKIRVVEEKLGGLEVAAAEASVDVQSSEAAFLPLVPSSRDAARQVIDDAEAARKQGIALESAIAQVSGRLIAAVDKIAGQVNQAIQENQPDFVALRAIISGLGQSFSQFTTVPEGLKGPADVAGGGVAQRTAGLRGALTDLHAAVADLSATRRIIADFVNAVVANKPLETLMQCGVDPEQIASPLSVDKTAVELTAGQAGSAAFSVSGGEPPYSGGLIGSPSGVEVSQRVPGDAVFGVTTTPAASAGEHVATVTDINRRESVIVKVVIKAGGGLDDKQDIASSLTPDQIGAVQRALNSRINAGLTVDNVVGDKTRQAVRDYQRSANRADQSGNLTQALVFELIGVTVTSSTPVVAPPPVSASQTPSSSAPGSTQPDPVVVVPPSGVLSAEDALAGFPNAVLDQSVTLNELGLTVTDAQVLSGDKKVSVMVNPEPGKRPAAEIDKKAIANALLELAGDKFAALSPDDIVIGNFEAIQGSLKP